MLQNDCSTPVIFHETNTVERSARMNRDPKTGRFLPGNQVAAGNKGNRKPKWGNQNAMKHGFCSNISFLRLQEDESLLAQSKGNCLLIKPGFAYKDENGNLMVHDGIIRLLREKGFVLNVE